MRESEQVEGKVELVVYSCHNVQRGPELHIFDECAIQAAGGIYGVEMELQGDTYWFVRLGTIEGQKGAFGCSYTEDALAGLPHVDLAAWRVGRRNPSFQRGHLERQIFDSLFQSLSAFLKSWNHKDDGVIEAYAIREISINPNRLSSMAGALTSIGSAHEIIGTTVLKYWYDPSWKTTWPSNELILAEFPLVIPIRLRWSNGKGLVATDVLALSSC